MINVRVRKLIQLRVESFFHFITFELTGSCNISNFNGFMFCRFLLYIHTSSVWNVMLICTLMIPGEITPGWLMAVPLPQKPPWAMWYDSAVIKHYGILLCVHRHGPWLVMNDNILIFRLWEAFPGSFIQYETLLVPNTTVTAKDNQCVQYVLLFVSQLLDRGERGLALLKLPLILGFILLCLNTPVWFISSFLKV